VCEECGVYILLLWNIDDDDDEDCLLFIMRIDSGWSVASDDIRLM
jgi:hypothetical protein